MSNDQDERSVNRRGFMQSALCGAGLAAILPADFVNLGKPPFQALAEMQGNCRWEKVILARFNNDALAAALEKCAESIGGSVFWAEDPPDIIAAPFFIGIIDRTLLGEKGWQSYLDYLAVVYDGKPLIIDGEVVHEGKGKEPPLILIDSDNSFQAPKPATLYHGSLRLYRSSPDNISEIIRIVGIEHEKVLNAVNAIFRFIL